MSHSSYTYLIVGFLNSRKVGLYVNLRLNLVGFGSPGQRLSGLNIFAYLYQLPSSMDVVIKILNKILIKNSSIFLGTLMQIVHMVPLCKKDF